MAVGNTAGHPQEIRAGIPRQSAAVSARASLHPKTIVECGQDFRRLAQALIARTKLKRTAGIQLSQRKRLCPIDPQVTGEARHRWTLSDMVKQVGGDRVEGDDCRRPERRRFLRFAKRRSLDVTVRISNTSMAPLEAHTAV